MARILFRPDAGPGIGMGHLWRSLALAAALRHEGVERLFLTVGGLETEAVPGGIDVELYQLKSIGSGGPDDWRGTLKAITDHGCQAVVVDSHRLSADYLSRLRQGGTIVVAFDDLADFPSPAHVVINGAIDADSLPYDTATGDTTFLLGPDYAVLREEFWRLEARAVRSEVREVLVTMGGADGRNLTPLVLDTLDSITQPFNVTLVVGPLFGPTEEIFSAAERSSHTVTVVRNPDSLLPLMLRADLAVSAAGQTVYELAATGTPAVSIQVADNQRHNLRSFASRGVVRPIIYTGGPELKADLLKETGAILADREVRRRMSEAGQGTVDGRGAERVGRWLAAFLRREGRQN